MKGEGRERKCGSERFREQQKDANDIGEYNLRQKYKNMNLHNYK